MTISLIFTRVVVWEGLEYIFYLANNAAFQMVGIACMDHKDKLHPNNLISTMVPWIKRRHAPQFCDEILNFQCCMTSFSHLVADLLNVRYIPQFWDEMTKFQCCKTSLPHIGAHIHTLFWKQCNVSGWLKLDVWVTNLNCIFNSWGCLYGSLAF